MAGKRCTKLGAIAIGALALASTPGQSCDWWSPCGDRPSAYRPAARGYGYGAPARAYRYRAGYPDPRWAYGYASPANAYTAWSSTELPPSRWYTATATPIPNAGAFTLTPLVTSRQGLLTAGLPASGPSLFGPETPPPPWGWGYYYNTPAPGYPGRYYGRGYGYRSGPAYGGPPADTASWWIEPRRRR